MKKLMLSAIVITILALSFSQAFAVSEAAVLSLMISPGARAAGMGEAFVAIADDATATFWNPAGLGFVDKKELHLMHVNWLPEFGSDMYYEFGSYVHPIEGVGTLGANVTFLNFGEQVNTDESGNELGKFASNEYSIALTYGTKLMDNWSVGLGLRYIRSNLTTGNVQVGAEQGTGQASAFGFDVATLYKFPFAPKLSAGLNLSNMGPKITYIDADQADPLPTNLKFGLAYKIVDTEHNKLTVTADMNKLMVNRKADGTSDPFYKALATSPWTITEPDQCFDSNGNSVDCGSDEVARTEKGDTYFNGIVSGGLEYWYSNYFALRAGYYYDRPGNVEYISVGGGLQYNLYRFDFAYVAAEEGTPLANTMRFSLTIGF